MSSAPTRAPNFELDGLKRLVVFLFIAVLFWVADNYLLSYKRLAGTGDTRDAMAMVDAAATGSVGSLRPVLYAVLCAFGMLCWMLRPAGLRLQIRGWLPALILLFVILVGTSVLWADEPELVMRRIVAFMFFVVAAWGIVQRFSNADLIRLCFVLGGIAGVLSLGSEIASGYFQPAATEYRLYGIMHANSLSAMCAIFILAGLALRQESDHRIWYMLAVVFGIGLLILTKSRSSMVGLMAALAVWTILGARDRRRAIVLGMLAVALIGPAVIFLFGEQLGDRLEKAILMGRDPESLGTGTGRLPLWDYLITYYVAERPFLGYGFQGFWSADHIRAASTSQGWVIMHGHSGYINALLDLGLIGLGLFVLIVVLSIARSYSYFRATGDRSWLFICALLTWAAVTAAFDTLLLSTSVRDFIWMLALAKVALFDPRVVPAREPALAPAT